MDAVSKGAEAEMRAKSEMQEGKFPWQNQSPGEGEVVYYERN